MSQDKSTVNPIEIGSVVRLRTGLGPYLVVTELTGTVATVEFWNEKVSEFQTRPFKLSSIANIKDKCW